MSLWHYIPLHVSWRGTKHVQPRTTRVPSHVSSVGFFRTGDLWPTFIIANKLSGKHFPPRSAEHHLLEKQIGGKFSIFHRYLFHQFWWFVLLIVIVMDFLICQCIKSLLAGLDCYNILSMELFIWMTFYQYCDINFHLNYCCEHSWCCQARGNSLHQHLWCWTQSHQSLSDSQIQLGAYQDNAFVSF